MKRGGWTYILASKPNGTLYTGVTSDLIGRVAKHRNGYYSGAFTRRYGVYLLVYYEGFASIMEAIAREKQLKGGSRKQKIELITTMNPQWSDLYPALIAQAEAPTSASSRGGTTKRSS
jgi:putative endonuclease